MSGDQRYHFLCFRCGASATKSPDCYGTLGPPPWPFYDKCSCGGRLICVNRDSVKKMPEEEFRFIRPGITPEELAEREGRGGD